MLKKILIGLVALLGLLAVVGLLLPRQVHMERSTTIDASRATVFTLVNGFKRFKDWSPWAGLDPNATYLFGGPATGVGARLEWKGDPKTVGSGSQEITESVPLDLVRSKLDFGPEGTAITAFTLAPEGGGVRVTWSFDTDLGMNPVSRYFGLFLERMLAPDWEKGLAGLKRLAESLPRADFEDLQVEISEVAPVTVAYVEASSAGDDQAIGAAIGAAYAQIGKFVAANRLRQAGAPRTITTRWDEAGTAFDAAIPIDRAPEKEIPPDSPVKVRTTYGGKALKVTHVGPYSGLAGTYRKFAAFIAAFGHETAGQPWEEYVSDPGTTPEAALMTDIYWPVK